MQVALQAIYESLQLGKLLRPPAQWSRDLKDCKNLWLVGLGKAAYHHVKALAKIYPDIQKKIAVVPTFYPSENDEIFFQGAHPELNDLSFKAGRELMRWLGKIPGDTSMIFCLSGGGSAMAEIPAQGLDEAFVQSVNSHLLRSGAPIIDMNMIRMSLSAFKNGGALCAFTGRPDVYLSVLSDIPTHDWRAVSSSPLMFQELNVTQVKDVAQRWLPEDLASQVITFLNSDLFTKLQIAKKTAGKKNKIHSDLVADGESALKVVGQHFKSSRVVNLGVLSCSLDQAIDLYLQTLKNIGSGPFAIISGGECPVTITTNNPGKGGRNTHFTLALAEKIFYQKILALTKKQLDSLRVASLATDGRDGNSLCAGAFFNYKMVSTTQPRRSLENFDSYTFLHNLQATVHFEEYQSNLMDLRILCGEM